MNKLFLNSCDRIDILNKTEVCKYISEDLFSFLFYNVRIFHTFFAFPRFYIDKHRMFFLDEHNHNRPILFD